jgi:hypothetical protein
VLLFIASPLFVHRSLARMRVPMIAFRYGVREATTLAAAATASASGAGVATPAAPATAAATAPQARILDSVWDLPEKLRPRTCRPEEQAYIRFGGCADYEVASKKGAPAKKK